jgi:hypothetical protein
MATRSARAKSRDLAKPGDPIVLADGSEHYPEPLPGEEPPEHSTGINPRTFKPAKKRTLKDLPTTPAMLNGIACVFMYTVMGIGDREMANALSITPAELTAIKKHPAYRDCFEGVLDEFISVNSNLIQARIAAYGNSAVTNIMDIASNGKKEENKLLANIDIADRAGIGGKNVQKNALNDLHITISKGDADDVKIDIGGINGNRT